MSSQERIVGEAQRGKTRDEYKGVKTTTSMGGGVDGVGSKMRTSGEAVAGEKDVE
jgi:hypothetical protein